MFSVVILYVACLCRTVQKKNVRIDESLHVTLTITFIQNICKHIKLQWKTIMKVTMRGSVQNTMLLSNVGGFETKDVERQRRKMVSHRVTRPSVLFTKNTV